MGFINGKKSYLLAIATIVYAISGVVTNHLTFHEAVNLVIASGAIATLRHGIDSVKK